MSTSPVRQASIHRFNRLVAMRIADDNTHYLDPDLARQLGVSLITFAASCERRPFRDAPGTTVLTGDTPGDNNKDAVVFVDRTEAAGTDRNGNVAKSLHCVDRRGRPLLLLIPGHSSYQAEAGCWYAVAYGGRAPSAPYDGRVAALSEMEA